jgi:cytidylate kinase
LFGLAKLATIGSGAGRVLMLNRDTLRPLAIAGLRHTFQGGQSTANLRARCIELWRLVDRQGASLTNREDAMAVIAMTREMATRGKDVAAGLSERLGLTVMHHELVEHDIAQRAGMRESEVHRFLEGEASVFERWKIDRKRLSRYTAEEILELAVNGNVLIRGWGATYLLRSVPHVICVRICAPMAFREKVLMERLNIKDRDLARAEIVGNDKAHNRTMQKMFGVDWMEATLYAIVLNTARVPVKDCVEHIVRLTECPPFQETTESCTRLRDALILSRVRSALDRRFGGIEATVSSSKVTLTGATSNEQLIVEAVRLVHTIDGVKGVESRIRHIAFQPSM